MPMYCDTAYRTVLTTSLRAAWEIEDVLPEGARLDLSRPLMPEALARTGAAPGLHPDERLVLNHICGNTYLAMFGLIEEFILPFVLDHARPHLAEDDWRTRALLNFAGEEAKHIQLFKRFAAVFARDFGEQCPVIGPAEAVGNEVLRHPPLAVALTILLIEWMTQAHYLGSARGAEIDPLFKSLLKHHWIEEASHAKLDGLMVEALGEGASEEELEAALEAFETIIAFLEGGLVAQVQLNLGALERRIGRTLSAHTRAALQAQQEHATRFTYLGSGLAHPRFRAAAAALSRRFAERIELLAARHQ
jgi:hypothetical protein